jgi:UrcA family protein
MRFILPLIALTALAAPVAAETVTVRVGYGDVDVATAEGRAALEARIDARLKKACANESAARYTLGRVTVDQVCLTEARTAAKAEIERVAALEARSGRSLAAN